MMDKEKPKYPPKPPENPTGRQMAKYLLKVIEVRHKNQAADHAAAEAKKLEREKIAAAKTLADRKAARISALRNQRSAMPEITVGKVAQYTLNPLDLQPTFRGFKYAAAILVQIFARILITVGLIAPDHPARTPSGALGYGLFRLL